MENKDLKSTVITRVLTHDEDIYQSTPPMSVAEAEAMGWCPDEPVSDNYLYHLYIYPDNLEP